MEMIPVAIVFLAPLVALGVGGIALIRYRGQSALVHELRPLGWILAILAVLTLVGMLLAFRFLEI